MPHVWEDEHSAEFALHIQAVWEVDVWPSIARSAKGCIRGKALHRPPLERKDNRARLRLRFRSRIRSRFRSRFRSRLRPRSRLRVRFCPFPLRVLLQRAVDFDISG